MSEQAELPPFKTLDEYAEVMVGDELGEALGALISIKRLTCHLSDEFAEAVEKEIASQLQDCQTYATIVEYVEKVTIERKRIEVEW